MIHEFSTQMSSQANLILDFINHHVNLLSSSASSLAKDTDFIELVHSNDLNAVQKRLTSFSTGKTYLENLFISTPGHNVKLGSKILADSVGNKSKGMIFGVNDPFSKTLQLSINGQASHSTIGKSPVTGKSVLLELCAQLSRR